MFAYLKANYTGQVIVLAPINRVTPSNAEQAPLDEYRNFLGEQTLKNGYSFVNGGEFNFPEEAGDFATDVYGGGLHPNLLGYRLYDKSLATELI